MNGAVGLFQNDGTVIRIMGISGRGVSIPRHGFMKIEDGSGNRSPCGQLG